MLWWMLRVDNWLDVASLENMEEDHSFLFLKKNLMKIFFFFWKIWKSWIFVLWIFFKELKILIDNFFLLKILEILNFFKELKILIDDFFFFFFESNLRSTSPMPLVLRSFWKFPSSFSFFFFLFSFFFFLFSFFFWNMKICSLSKSKKDEDKDGVKVMKIYSWWFFFFG